MASTLLVKRQRTQSEEKKRSSPFLPGPLICISTGDSSIKETFDVFYNVTKVQLDVLDKLIKAAAIANNSDDIAPQNEIYTGDFTHLLRGGARKWKTMKKWTVDYFDKEDMACFEEFAGGARLFDHFLDRNLKDWEFYTSRDEFQGKIFSKAQIRILHNAYVR